MTERKDRFKSALDNLTQSAKSSRRMGYGARRRIGSITTNRKIRFKSALDDLTQNAKSAGKSATQGAKAVGGVAAQGAKTVGETTTRGAKVAGNAAARGSEVAKDVAAQGAKSAGDAATRAGRVAGSAANQGVRVAGDGVGAIRQRAPWDSVFPEQIRNSLTDAIESSKTLSGSAKRRLTAQLGSALDDISRNGLIGQAQAFTIIQGIMASDQISRAINGWLQDLVSGSATIYDKAMDASFIETGIGGPYHRLFDGGHTLAGAFQAVRDASPDDSIFEEAVGLLQALARDATTPMGLPLVTWNEDTFNGLADTLGNFGITRAWLNDLVSYDVVELVAGSIGILAVALNWNNDDVEEFSNIVGSMGLASIVSANPLMLIVTVAALAKAFHSARKSGDWKEFSDGLAKGGICTGAVLLTTSLVSGPAVVVLLSGICVGILANQAAKRVSFVEIGQFMVSEMRKAPAMLESAVASAKDVLPTST